MIEHLPRWTHASIKDKIKRNFSGCPIFIEGENDRKPEADFWIELRIDGPVIRPVGTNSEYRGEVQVNMVLTVNKDEKYVHILQDKVGLAIKVLNQCFEIKKVGSTDPVDDGSSVTVLQLMPDQDIDFSNFGQVDPTVRVQQASVEAHYRFLLEL
jgi:hypothetical protein